MGVRMHALLQYLIGRMTARRVGVGVEFDLE